MRKLEKAKMKEAKKALEEATDPQEKEYWEGKMGGYDAMQLVYKELMNSTYGKLIQKTPDSEVKYRPAKDELSFIEKYYNHVKDWYPVRGSNYLRFEIYKSLDDSYSAPHLGCQILSYSKRIMNQVMCLADDHQIKIYYQDTDSIHIEAHKVDKLNALYKSKYHKELIGEDLGEFHNDFDPEEWKGKGYKDVVSVGLIATGKKMYIDKLRGVAPDGTTHYTYHKRLKGITDDAITERCLKTTKELNKDYDEWSLFEDLALKKPIQFNLGCNNRVRFEKSKGQECSTYSKGFARWINREDFSYFMNCFEDK